MRSSVCSAVKPVSKIQSVNEGETDDLLLTCSSFEDRFLGVPKLLSSNCFKKMIMFKFRIENDKRDKLVRDMEKIISIKEGKNYKIISVDHGKSLESVLSFHEYIKKYNTNNDSLNITIDISTFTKDLLINLLYYIIRFLKTKKLRLLYTVPGRYASPQEGWLSSGVKEIHIPPMCWNEWSPLKDNLLITILGFEEMRAWSLIDNFSADQNWLYLTKPGSKPEWDNLCQDFNENLFKIYQIKGELPALNPVEMYNILSQDITVNIADKYNIFISPFGTKLQVIGVLLFNLYYKRIQSNLLTTTAITHNAPYYSWDIGDTYEYYFPLNGGMNFE